MATSNNNKIKHTFILLFSCLVLAFFTLGYAFAVQRWLLIFIASLLTIGLIAVIYSYRASLSLLQPRESVEASVDLDLSESSQTAFDRQLRQSVLLDPDTGIGNRDYFDNRLEALLKEDHVQGAVFFIQFSQGDKVVASLGNKQAKLIFTQLIRSIVKYLEKYPEACISRKGSFELALLVPEVFLTDAEKLADRLVSLCASVDVPSDIREQGFVHIGVSYFSHEQSAYQIKSEADMALRSAQLQGPSQWFMFEPGEVEQSSAKGSLQWRTFLEKAIAKNLFVLFFQPVMARNSEQVLHHEVLAKVRDHDGDLISARVFLPMAVKCGLIQPIDMQVIEQICRLLSYDSHQTDDCSFNLSIESLLSETFIERFSQLLNTIPDVAKRLIVELPEYQVAKYQTQLTPSLVKLKQLGVKVLIDKVGQFVESAQYLNLPNIHFIKLDASIVLNIHQRPDNQAFVRSLVTICQQKNVDVFALGVESLDEWLVLQKLGISGGQGHYFTEPVAQVAKAIHLH